MENEKKNPRPAGEQHHKKHKPNHKKSYFIDPAAPNGKQEIQIKSHGGESTPVQKSDDPKSGNRTSKSNHKRPHHKPKHIDNEKNEKDIKNVSAKETQSNKDVKKDAPSVAANIQDAVASTASSKNNNRKNKNHRDRKPPSTTQKLSLSLSDIPEAVAETKALEEEEHISIESITLEEILGETKKNTAPSDTENENVPMTEVVGIRFKSSGKIYYFDPVGKKYTGGKHAIVETARGQEYGEIVFGNKLVKESETVPPLRPVIRTATEADIQHHKENKAKEDAAFKICNEKIISHGLDMKLIDVQYTFDNTKLLFYFTSAGRVDFRELVKDLASVFRTRIELRQIGIRDEAKMMGGLGPCGRSLCCSLFLTDFGQVSIKMAKEQNLSLNSSKISGVCGRLMCCLRYEYETYEYEIKRTPPIDSIVKTPDGVGTVTEMNPLAGTVKVRLNETPDTAPKAYNRNDVVVLQKKQPQNNEEE